MTDITLLTKTTETTAKTEDLTQIDGSPVEQGPPNLFQATGEFIVRKSFHRPTCKRLKVVYNGVFVCLLAFLNL